MNLANREQIGNRGNIKPPFIPNFSRLKVLALSAVLLIVNAAILIFWLDYSKLSQQQQNQGQYYRAISNAASSQIGSFIHSQDISAITNVAEQLVKQAHIRQVAIYQLDSTLLVKKINTSSLRQKSTQAVANLIEDQDSKRSQNTIKIRVDSVVTNILFNDNNIGYLIIDFTNINPSSNNTWTSDTSIIIFCGSFLWLFILLVFNFRRVKEALTLSKENIENKNFESTEVTLDTKNLFQQLLKRNQERKDKTQADVYLAIEGQWSNIEKERTNQLIFFFNRFLPHANMQIISLKNAILILGFTGQYDKKKVQQSSILLESLQKLNLEANIVVHSNDFTEENYQTIFSKLEPGIWCETSSIFFSQDSKNPEINIEIEKDKQIIVTQVSDYTNSDINLIERQSRFFLRL